ncbi:MAG: DNA repair protein RecO [Proteobacteria bacterium]|nr:DNA repair protein RecO [Pseudomonadota bacterium]
MNWTDIGVLLSCRKYGENSVIVHAFTKDHGRTAGLVRGGTGRRLRGLLQPGNEVQLTWRGRLPEQLGNFTVDAKLSFASQLFDIPLALLASSSAMSVLDIFLPEREPHPRLYEATLLLLAALEESEEVWPVLYAKWELGVLSEVGYGLDLSSCAATNVTEGLVYVSPKSGRAVSRDAGKPYHEKLLPLPPFLAQDAGGASKVDEIPASEVMEALKLTGYFLEKIVQEHKPTMKMSARERFIDSYNRQISSRQEASDS